MQNLSSNDPPSLIISNSHKDKQAWKGTRPTPLCKFPSIVFSKHLRSQELVSLLASNSWRSQIFKLHFMNSLSTFPFTYGNTEGTLKAAQDTNQKLLTRAKKTRQCWSEIFLWKWSSETPFYQGHATTVILHTRLFDVQVAGTREKLKCASLEKPKIQNRNTQESYSDPLL